MKKNDFGKKLKLLRAMMGEKQKTFARKLDIANSTLSKYEKNLRSPDADFLIKLKKITKVNLNWLLSDDADINSMFADTISHKQLKAYLTQMEILIEKHKQSTGK